jgi:uncharacterized protein (TIGR00725 family)
MEFRSRPRIGVMGPGSCSPEVYELARQVGFLLAEKGAILISGGMGGAMEAAAKGAKEAGGITIGILPGNDEAEANPYIDIPIVTDLGNARNVINVLTSQAIVAVHGAHGTLSEIALAMKCRIPVVGLKTWDLVSPEGGASRIARAESAEEAVETALKLASSK